MNDAPKTHYLNSDFDLSLRPHARQLHNPTLVRQVRELSVQALLGARADDYALVRADVPREFSEYLAGAGIPVPRLLLHPDTAPPTELRPFGWSAEAIELNRRHDRPAAHPVLSAVRRANSRSLALELEARLTPEIPRGSVVKSLAELENFLSLAPSSSEWVIKSEHGHAGLANRRLRAGGFTPVDRSFVERHLVEDERMIVEPWLQRERDWCTVFDVPFDSTSLRIHESICTRDGALIGALFDSAENVPGSVSEELTRMAAAVAASLSDEEYFGPVCADSFSWHDGADTRLRPLVDLNCRRSMSDGAWRLWRRVAPDRTLYYRFFNRRKLELPDGLAGILAELGPHRYDRSTRRGTLLASPPSLAIDGKSGRPGKIVVAFVADDRRDVFKLERWFRERFER